ncbi:MAG: rod shape-determining protein MreD [Prevotella sp.]|nr:rod shape-determining protein MreD [Prevotella sp.]
MSIDLIRKAGLFVAFALVQILVLGRIHLFDCATPLLYVYFVLLFPRNYPKWAILLWSFALGLVVDIAYNTPGLTAASLTLVGVIQPYFFELFVPRDSVEDLKPSMRTIGMMRYLYYSSFLVTLHCLAFFLLEAFNFFNWMEWVKCVVGSTLITMLLILTFETLANKRG